MGAISSVETLADNQVRKLFLLVVTIAYYPNGKLAYVHVSIGGIVALLVIMLLGKAYWGQLYEVLTKLSVFH